MSTVNEKRLSSAANAIPLVALAAIIGIVIGVALELATKNTTLFANLIEEYSTLATLPIWQISTLVAVAIGVTIALATQRNALRALVSREVLTLHWADATVTVPRPLIDSIVVADDLILRSRTGVELARVHNSFPASELASTLKRYGYPAPLSEDPDSHEFVPWTEAERSVSSDVYRILQVRASLLAQGALGQAEALRREAVSRGVMVRDIRDRRFGIRQELRAA